MSLIYGGLILALIYISYTVLEGVVNDGSIGLINGVHKGLSGELIALYIVFPTFYAVLHMSCLQNLCRLCLVMA